MASSRERHPAARVCPRPPACFSFGLSAMIRRFTYARGATLFRPPTELIVIQSSSLTPFVMMRKFLSAARAICRDREICIHSASYRSSANSATNAQIGDSPLVRILLGSHSCRYAALAQLLQCGLLRGSFVPPRPLRILRDLTRHRARLQGEHTRVSNRTHKLLEDANIKLGEAASDVLGKLGRKMLRALLQRRNRRFTPST